MGLLNAYGTDPENQDPNNSFPGNETPAPTAPAPTGPTYTNAFTLQGLGGTPGGGGGGGPVPGIGASPDFHFGRVPQFNAPAFVRPDAQSILSAPGYQARLQSGEDALQRSAASKGLLRSGGTLKDLIQYGQNFASNEYNNEFNQALQTYGANYQLSKDKYAPLLAEWDTLSKAEIQRALAAYNRGTIWNNPHGGGGGGGGMSEIFQQFPG